jgi:uncharacterized OB-fold protein
MTVDTELTLSRPLPYKPIREGLFQFDPPTLLGSTCTVCGTSTFPARDFCPGCLADGPRQNSPLARRGSVFTYTVVYQAPGGRPTPYVLGYVDLDDNVRVLAQLDVPVDRVSIGMRVGLVLREVGESDGVSVVGYAFASDADSKEVKQ